MSPSPNSDMPIKINDLEEVEGDDHRPHGNNHITVPNPETFHPKNHPDLGLDYIFEVLCAVRRLARQLDKDFVGYLIEMAILEVDKERKAESKTKAKAKTKAKTKAKAKTKTKSAATEKVPSDAAE